MTITYKKQGSAKIIFTIESSDPESSNLIQGSRLRGKYLYTNKDIMTLEGFVAGYAYARGYKLHSEVTN